jgi:hypothetical protein
MDRKGIISFLAIMFGLTYAIELPPILGGFRLAGITSSIGTYIFLPIMFMPVLGAVVTAKYITKEGLAGMNIRFGSWKSYIGIGLLIPALFALIYGVTWALGLGEPDWNLETFKNTFISSGVPVPAMPDTRLVLLLVFLATLTVGTLFNWVFCCGEELGWRGYLLPKLMPLGKVRAYLLLGLIWSVWHWPLVLAGFVYSQIGSFWSLAAFTALTTGFGIYLNELTLHQKSSILAGWAHGVFNTQKVGMWYLLFPQASTYLGGYAGLIGLATWFGLGLWEMRNKSAKRDISQAEAAS